MTAPETPAQTVRRAAEKLRKLANGATPGPWHRPLNARNKAIVTAPLPEGETGSYISGIDPSTGERERCCVVMANTWSDGKHFRKRSGRDLEFIAAIHPGIALLVTDQWDLTADLMEYAHAEIDNNGSVYDEYGTTRHDWTALHDIALTFLGEEVPQ